MKQISIDIKYNGRSCSYNSETGLVTTTTKNKVVVTAEIPPSWAITRTVQFMDSLLRTELI